MTCVAALSACSSSGDGNPLSLRPSKTSVLPDGKDEVRFTVTYEGQDVTAAAAIWQLAGGDLAADTKLEGAVFTTATAGTYRFEARYESETGALVSDPVTVTAKSEGGSEASGKFFRRVFAQKFTSTGCTGCPALSKELDKMEESAKWEDRMVHAAFHMNYSGTDPMTVGITASYMSRYNQQALPALYYDVDVDTYCLMQPGVTESLEKQLAIPAGCGVAIESKYDAEANELEFTVKALADETNDFRVLPFLVEDGIVAYQVNGYPTPEEQVHNHTVRMALSASLTGDRLASLEAGAEGSKTFKTALSPNWKAENMRVVVCVLHKTDKGFVGTNAAECALNGSVDYKYNE